jgi:hypothetical protein
MSPMSRASKFDGLRRAVAVPVTAEKPSESEDYKAPGEAPRRPRPEKPVRFTLDLDRAHHPPAPARAWPGHDAPVPDLARPPLVR